MTKRFLFTLVVLTSLSFLSGCGDKAPEYAGIDPVLPGSDQFDQQWYDGKAELNRYDLKQARYGEIHEGHALMVFVTEPFDLGTQVKSDRGGNGTTSVLKLNAIRRFTTGIYDYSMMQSVFMPIDQKEHPAALKVTTSSQDWCGHSFMQLNRNGDGYQFKLHSYFEGEGEVDKKIDVPLLEDGLWTQIRIDPTQLPQGEIQILPATTDIRLRHLATQPEAATARLEEDPDQKDQMLYILQYHNIERTLTIRFKSSFPYQIQGWTEAIKSGFGPNAKPLETTATLTHSVRDSYWDHHDVSHEPMRQGLGL